MNYPNLYPNLNGNYYASLLTFKDLFEDTIEDIIAQAAKMAQVIDKVEGDDFKAFLGIVFIELIDNLPSNIYTRYVAGTDPKKLVNVLAKKMYQCASPAYQQKQFFNNSYSWQSISDLLTETKTTKFKSNNKAQSSGSGVANTDNKGTSTAYNLNHKQGDPNLDPKYATAANESDGTGNSKTTTNGASSSDSNAEGTVTNQTLKMDYLTKIYDIIDRQKYSITDAFYNFVNVVAIPNQNIAFEVFPWPWTFNLGNNL